MQSPITYNENELPRITEELARQLRGGDVLLLSGELGSGKTTFTTSLAQALHVREAVTSPTYTLMNIYTVHNHATINRLCHIDTYRIKSQEELREIGVEDFVGAPDTLTVIEWPEKYIALDPSPTHVLHLHFAQGKTEQERILTKKD